MLRLRRITNLVVLTFILAVTFSCSENEEVLEQQDPQSQISTELSQRLVTNTGGNSEEAEKFNDDITWYKSSDIDPSYCGVQGALLAYELFDANNNSLDGILITGWSLESGISIEDTVIQLEQIAEQEYEQGVQLIFVAAVLIKPIDENTADVAQVSNYTVFADYFKDCQSSNVIFEEEDNSIEFTSLMPEPDPVDFPDDTVACASIEFPVDIIVADENDANVTSQVTVDEQGLIDYLTGNVPGFVFVDFVYPVNVNLEDGTQLAANSSVELEQIFDQNCN